VKKFVRHGHASLPTADFQISVPAKNFVLPFSSGTPLFWQNEQNWQGIVGKKQDQNLLV
jgi:hypothetical protein